MTLDASGRLFVGLTSGYSNGVTIKGASDDYALTIAQSNSSTAGWGMWADTGGNFKLARYGTTYNSPALTITLAGLATFSQAATFSSSVTASSLTSTGDLFLTTTGAVVFNSAANFNTQIYHSSGSLVFYTGASERARITSGGNVLIGDTGDYLSSKLNLKSADSTSSTNIIACRNSSGTDYFRVRSDGYTYALGVYNNTTGSGANVFVGAGGDFLRSTSSLKYKYCQSIKTSLL
jgi:hypothetical protein